MKTAVSTFRISEEFGTIKRNIGEQCLFLRVQKWTLNGRSKVDLSVVNRFQKNRIKFVQTD